MIEIGTLCEVVNARVPSNRGAAVIVVGDAGMRNVNEYGLVQCCYIDRKLPTKNGKMRNWAPETQLNPLPPLCDKYEEAEQALTPED